jgi:hypothetical protein
MDLVCIRDPDGVDEGLGICEVLYVQCKTNGKISVIESMNLIEHSKKYGAMPVLAFKDKKGHIVIEVLN